MNKSKYVGCTRTMTINFSCVVVFRRAFLVASRRPSAYVGREQIDVLIFKFDINYTHMALKLECDQHCSKKRSRKQITQYHLSNQ